MGTNEEKIIRFADFLTPLFAIITDEEVEKEFRSGKPKIVAVQLALRKHPKDVADMLALNAGADPEAYDVGNPLDILLRILAILNEPYVKELFIGQGQKNG